MGMFDRDKEFGNRIDDQYGIGVPFVLLGVNFPGRTISTKLGDSEIVELLTMRIGDDGFVTGSEIVCSSIASAIVEKCREADDDDFPAVVELRRVTSTKHGRSVSALVLQYVAPYAAPTTRVTVSAPGDVIPPAAKK